MLPWSVDHVRSARHSAAATAVAFVLLCLPFVGPSTGLTSPVRGATHAVQIGDGFFSPASLTVAVGDTITWTNGDDSPHTVTGAAFDSGNLEGGQTFSFTFQESGTFTYACQYHDEMVGTITVVAGAGGSGQQAPAAATPAPSAAAAPAAPAPDAPAPDAPTASHAAGHGAGQPDTALLTPGSVARMASWIAPLLIGVGLLAFAIGVVPQRGSRVEVRHGRRSAGGWRR